MRLSLLAVICGFALFVPVSKGQAQVAMDASGMGLVILGYDNRTCDTSIEGAIRYDSSASKVQVCEPSGNSCPNIGDICADGSVYAGLSTDGNVPIYTTPSDAPTLMTWNDGSTNFVDTAMLNCTTSSPTPGFGSPCQTGETNTSDLAALSGSGSPAPYQAAEHCDGLSAYGHGDWHLPAIDELYVFYTNRFAIDGFKTSASFPDMCYWSSSENSDTYAMIYCFDNSNTQGPLDKNYSLSIRCARRSTSPPLNYGWTNWGE